jgi:DNA-binding NtrC family response regulator
VHGLDVLRAIKTVSPSTDVIVMTGYGTLPTAIQAMDYAASG